MQDNIGFDYITGIHALNLPCSLDTDGDWHCSALKWDKPTTGNTGKSVFGDYGIEFDKEIPEHSSKYAVANHIRALLDMLDRGQFGYAQGMRDDFTDESKHTNEIFNKVILLRGNDNWDDISEFMGSEYYCEWLDFLESKAYKSTFI